jgi:hypothetical protein
MSVVAEEVESSDRQRYLLLPECEIFILEWRVGYNQCQYGKGDKHSAGADVSLYHAQKTVILFHLYFMLGVQNYNLFFHRDIRF